MAQEASNSVDEVDSEMATGVVLLEKELHIGPITEDYPLMKFFIQLEKLREFKEKEDSYSNSGSTKTFG